MQVRDADDPMAPQEVAAFGQALKPLEATITTFDLLSHTLRPNDLGGVDFIFLGGSGAYSATQQGEPWLERALDSLRIVHGSRVPTFASCWGFQGMAAAMGGTVVNDRSRAELGTHKLRLTTRGFADPIFRYLGDIFWAQMGHEDLVLKLPPNTTLLASSDRVINQAYHFHDAPVYCTQFHPELDKAAMLARFKAYPRYATEVAGMTIAELAGCTRETPRTAELVRRFVEFFLEYGVAGWSRLWMGY